MFHVEFRQAVVFWLMAINYQLGEIVSAVQVDQSVLDNAGNALSAIAQAVETFLTTEAAQQLPQATLDTLNNGLTAAQKAQSDLTSADTTAPAPEPVTDTPVSDAPTETTS